MLTGFLIGLVFAVVVAIIARLNTDTAVPSPSPSSSGSAALTPPPASLPKVNWFMEVPATGQEAFTPEPLKVARVYRLTFSGTYAIYLGSGWSSPQADAIFYTDDKKNFHHRYAGVEVDGLRAGKGELDSWTENRADHRFSCLVDGKGERMPIRIDNPNGGYGHLDVQIDLLPASTPPVAVRQNAKAQAKAAREQTEAAAALARKHQDEATKKLAEDQKRLEQQKQKQAQREAVIRKRVLELTVLVHHNRNLMDLDFCEHFVKKNQREILRDKAVWCKEYETLMADQELLPELKLNAPEVLQFFERRVSMIDLAEKLAIMPPDSAVQLSDRKITPRTLGRVEHSISELFRLRDQIDSLQERQVTHGFDSGRQNQIDIAFHTMRFFFKLLNAYGIVADTPERAEDRFFELCPYQPVLTIYEELIESVVAGKEVSPDVVKSRLEDLHREEIILQAKRRRTIRTGHDEQRDAIDERLSIVRRESSQLCNFLTAIGCSLEFPDYREREETREAQFFKLMEEKRNIIAALAQQGDAESVEHVEALFAQEQAKLFSAGDESYT